MLYHFDIWRGHCPLASRFEHLKIFIWGWPNLQSYFSAFVNQRTRSYVDTYGGVRSRVGRFLPEGGNFSAVKTGLAKIVFAGKNLFLPELSSK